MGLSWLQRMLKKLSSMTASLYYREYDAPVDSAPARHGDQNNTPDSSARRRSKHRREAAIQARIDHRGMTPNDAIQMVENVGVKLISKFLGQNGYVYDEAGRRWLIKQRRVKG
jgi:hypothetical protein